MFEICLIRNKDPLSLIESHPSKFATADICRNSHPIAILHGEIEYMIVSSKGTIQNTALQKYLLLRFGGLLLLSEYSWAIQFWHTSLNQQVDWTVSFLESVLYYCIVYLSQCTTRIYICRLLLLCKHNTTTYIMEYRSDLGLEINRSFVSKLSNYELTLANSISCYDC